RRRQWRCRQQDRHVYGGGAGAAAPHSVLCRGATFNDRHRHRERRRYPDRGTQRGRDQGLRRTALGAAGYPGAQSGIRCNAGRTGNCADYGERRDAGARRRKDRQTAGRKSGMKSKHRMTAAIVHDTPVPARESEEFWGSDPIAAMLRELDIPYISIVPGSSYRGLHDSIVNYLGNRAPQMVLNIHEENAVAVAHGYAKVTDRMMAAAVHANVGLLRAPMAIYNAWCDRAPILIL